ncbi:hypothetical protein ACJX0J_010113 [Zea mays]
MPFLLFANWSKAYDAKIQGINVGLNSKATNSPLHGILYILISKATNQGINFGKIRYHMMHAYSWLHEKVIHIPNDEFNMKESIKKCHFNFDNIMTTCIATQFSHMDMGALTGARSFSTTFAQA